MLLRFPVLALLLVLLGHSVSVQGSLQSCRQAALSSLDECACFPGCTAVPNEDGNGHEFVFSNSTSSRFQSLAQQANCGNPYARISASDFRINYGTVGPYDIVHHLYDRCHEFACDPNPFSMQTYTLDGNGRQTQTGTISVVGNGFYRSWNDRNGFVELLATAAGSNIDREVRKPGANCRPGSDCEPNSINQFQQYNFYQVDHWNDCGHQGQVKATVTVSTENKWSFLCKYGFFVAQTALAPVSAGAAALFGALSLNCP